MHSNRLIPQLLIKDERLVKTIRFKNPTYVGDAVNAVRIFNEKGADELFITDISTADKGINYKFIEEVVSEAFIPVSYSGGVRNVQQAQRLFELGVEKVVLNTLIYTDIVLVKELVAVFGAQSIAAQVNINQGFWGGRKVYDHNRSRNLSVSIDELVNQISSSGAGEVILNSVYLDGTMEGLDLSLLEYVNDRVDIPIVLSGGLASTDDFYMAIDAGADAVAGGAFFVYKGEHRAVLITYPKEGGFGLMERRNDRV